MAHNLIERFEKDFGSFFSFCASSVLTGADVYDFYLKLGDAVVFALFYCVEHIEGAAADDLGAIGEEEADAIYDVAVMLVDDELEVLVFYNS